jgi:hypothetical protein
MIAKGAISTFAHSNAVALDSFVDVSLAILYVVQSNWFYVCSLVLGIFCTFHLMLVIIFSIRVLMEIVNFPHL